MTKLHHQLLAVLFTGALCCAPATAAINPSKLGAA